MHLIVMIYLLLVMAPNRPGHMLQGMNFIAGCLLLFMAEEDAFWCLAVIVEELLPGYFSLAMVAPQVAPDRGACMTLAHVACVLPPWPLCSDWPRAAYPFKAPPTLCTCNLQTHLPVGSVSHLLGSTYCCSACVHVV